MHDVPSPDPDGAGLASGYSIQPGHYRVDRSPIDRRRGDHLPGRVLYPWITPFGDHTQRHEEGDRVESPYLCADPG